MSLPFFTSHFLKHHHLPQNSVFSILVIRFIYRDARRRKTLGGGVFLKGFLGHLRRPLDVHLNVRATTRARKNILKYLQHPLSPSLHHSVSFMPFLQIRGGKTKLRETPSVLLMIQREPFMVFVYHYYFILYFNTSPL